MVIAGFLPTKFCPHLRVPFPICLYNFHVITVNINIKQKPGTLREQIIGD